MTDDGGGKTFLILHGWGGNKPEAWQEWLFLKLLDAGADVRYPRFPNPAAPNAASWLVMLHEAVQGLPDPELVTVLCHSLGGVNWINYCNAVKQRIADRVLLVAPPYVSPIMRPVDTPSGIETFFVPGMMNSTAVKLAARETTIIAGGSDCYGTEDQLSAYAALLDVKMHLLRGAGHVSPHWGYGEWPWVLEWALGRAELPPEPREWTPTIAAPLS